MDKNTTLKQIANILREWCQKRSANIGDIDFKIDYCSGITHIRFTTQCIDTVLPSIEGVKGAWGNEHYIFYEISNRFKRINISCVLGRKDLNPEQEEVCRILINGVGKALRIDWEYDTLKTWKVYNYDEDSSLDDISNLIEIRLDEIIDNHIKKFENDIFRMMQEEEPTLTTMVSEGRQMKYFTTKYERSWRNKREAIRLHGTKCMVCNFDFLEVYGELGKEFIEVHHVKPLSSLDGETIVNPQTDLVCLCSNCHSMIHRRNDSIMSIEELKGIIKNNR